MPGISEKEGTDNGIQMTQKNKPVTTLYKHCEVVRLAWLCGWNSRAVGIRSVQQCQQFLPLTTWGKHNSIILLCIRQRSCYINISCVSSIKLLSPSGRKRKKLCAFLGLIRFPWWEVMRRGGGGGRRDDNEVKFGPRPPWSSPKIVCPRKCEAEKSEPPWLSYEDIINGYHRFIIYHFGCDWSGRETRKLQGDDQDIDSRLLTETRFLWRDSSLFLFFSLSIPPFLTKEETSWWMAFAQLDA